MHIQHVYAIYFSPTGNTKRIVCQGASEAARLFQVPCRAISLNLPKDRETVHTFSAGDLVIVGGPTYAGKLPNKILPTYQEKLIGKGALALAVVTYGNRSFDNSLAELCATLDGNGFRTVAAGAFVGTHAFSDVLAPDRPDKDDLALMVRLTDMAVSKIRQTDGMVPRLVVDGDARAPYYVPKGVDGQPPSSSKPSPRQTWKNAYPAASAPASVPWAPSTRTSRPSSMASASSASAACATARMAPSISTTLPFYPMSRC